GERSLDDFALFPPQRRIGARAPALRQVSRQSLLPGPAPQMSQRQIDGNPVSPSAKVSSRIKAAPRAMNSPECLHGQVLSDAWVADDAHDPGVDAPLKLPKQRLERIQITFPESCQQVHGGSIVLYSRSVRAVHFFLAFRRSCVVKTILPAADGTPG